MALKPRGAPESIGSIGDITALASVSTPTLSLLCVGVAAQILIFDVLTGKQLSKTCWEGGVRIHGIRASKLEGEIEVGDGRIDADADGSTSSSTMTTFLLVAHGDRGAASYLLSVGKDSVSLRETWRRSFGAWTLDVVPFCGGGPSSSSSVVVAVGAADGSVSLHRAASSPSSSKPSSSPASSDDSLILDSRCAERCLLYSMALLPKDEENENEGGGTEWWVAGGSVFLDVLVWNVTSSPSRSGGVLSCPVLFRLSGHEGSIHRVAWAPIGARGGLPDSDEKPRAAPSPPPSSLLLASASDDRSLRLWSIPSDRKPGSEAIPGPVFRGHGSRLWDIVFVSAPLSRGGDSDENGDSASSAFSRSFRSSSSSYPPRFVLSTSEDCSARLWSVLGQGKEGKEGKEEEGKGGKEVAILRGHRGRGIWRAAAVLPSSSSSSSLSFLPLIATAGADGAVQLWRLSDHVSSRKEGDEGRLLGFPPPLLLAPSPSPSPSPGDGSGGGGERVETSSPSPSFHSHSSSAGAVRTLYAAGPGVLLVGTGEGAVWRVDLNIPGEEGGEGTEGPGGEGRAGGETKTGRDSWSLVFRAPKGGSVLSLAAVACGRHGLGGSGEGGSSSSSSSSRSCRLSCPAASSSSCSSSSSSSRITRATPLLVLAALGRGEAALGCDCARFLGGEGKGGGNGENCRPAGHSGDVAPELRWNATPGEEVGVPLFRCFLPPELGGDVALTTSTLGDLSVWKLPRERKKGEEEKKKRPPLLVAAAPPRRARRQRDLAVSCVVACALRRMLFAGDSAGGLLAYSLPVSLFEEKKEEGEVEAEEMTPPTPVLAVAAKTKTPDESAVTCLRLLRLPLPPPSSASSTSGKREKEEPCCCGELRVGDCAGRATTLRLTPNPNPTPTTSPSPSPSPSLPFSLQAVGGERLPFPLVISDTDHPDASVLSAERVVCGFSGETWIAVSYPRAGGGGNGEGEEGEEEEEGSCFEVARATTGGWRRPAALVPGCRGLGPSLPAVPAALVHCVPSRRGGGGRDGGEGGELVAREWGSRGERRSEKPSASAAPLARIELPAGHGLEVHASVALPCPLAAESDAAAAVLTASEDGSLRWLLVKKKSSGSEEEGEEKFQSLAASGLVRALSDGSALRACAFVRTPGGSKRGDDFLVFASGVRAYVTAWRAWWSGGEEKEKVGVEKKDRKKETSRRLHTAWLAASSAGVRSGRAARRASSRCSRAEAGPRALHAAAFEIEEGEGKVKKGVVAVLVATSLGAVEAVAFDSVSGGFLQSSSSSDSEPVRLECHEGPALCVSHLSMPPSEGDDDGKGPANVFKKRARVLRVDRRRRRRLERRRDFPSAPLLVALF